MARVFAEKCTQMLKIFCIEMALVLTGSCVKNKMAQFNECLSLINLLQQKSIQFWEEGVEKHRNSCKYLREMPKNAILLTACVNLLCHEPNPCFELLLFTINLKIQ